MDKDKGKYLFFLHILLMVYSLSTVCSKMASRQEFLSFKFCLFYGGVVVLLGIYAIVWQQIIKKLHLTLAYANKAVTVFWGIVWGLLFFEEKVSALKIIGAVMVIAGIAVYSFAENENEAPDNAAFADAYYGTPDEGDDSVEGAEPADLPDLCLSSLADDGGGESDE